MKKSQKAFSLIELSIVILIIGILIAGVTQSSRLVKQFRVRTGQTLTQSSPVNSIPNLALWYEPTLDASFLTSERENGKSISIWRNTNSQSTFKNNATQTTSDSRPLYIADSINGLPAVRFDGTDDFFNFDGTFLVGSSYTIFVVEQQNAYSDIAPYLCGADQGADNDNLLLAQQNIRGLMLFTQDGDGSLSAPSTIFTTPIARFHTIMSGSPEGDDPGVGKAYWFNGGVLPDVSDNTLTAPLVSYNGANIGQAIATYYLNGDIAEIIMFTRALSTEERQSVEGYLSKKYNIKIVEEITAPPPKGGGDPDPDPEDPPAE